MIGICQNCGNYDWDKEVKGNQIICPKCKASWKFRKLPLFLLTGCSGVGKTTTGQAMLKRNVDFVVLDADMFYNLMPHETQEDYCAQVEQLEALSKNIMQSGKPVLWTMAGNLDKVNQVYHRRFFSDIYCLALVCTEAELRDRMRNGRGITDENWIQGSVDYNEYFRTHDTVYDLPFETLDMSGKTAEELAAQVEAWVQTKLKNH